MSNQLLKSVGVVSAMTFMSRVLGFLRDLIIAHLFGAGANVDAFILAFKIPNFMRRLFAEGAFSQAFVPVLSEYRATKEPAQVKDLINKVCGTLMGVLLLVTLLGILFAPIVVRLFAPGYAVDDVRFTLAPHLLMIMFPYILLISLSGFAAGIQNTYKQFALPALAPIILNICLIIAAYGFARFFVQPVMALAWGVVIGGALQLLVQLAPLQKLHLFPKPQWAWHDPQVQKVLRLMVPGLISGSVMQVNLLVDSVFASFLPVGSLTWLYYSDRLLEFPLGIFGVGFGIVMLPHLSRVHAKADETHFSASIDWALRWTLLIGIPATVGLIILAQPLMVSLFNYGKFNEHDVIMSSQSLIGLSLGLIAFLTVKIMVQAFYARQNTRVPNQIALWAMLINVILNALFIVPLAHAGLALASSLASFFNVISLFWILRRQKIYNPTPGWQRFHLSLLTATLLMGILLWWLCPDIDTWFSWDMRTRLFSILGLILSGFLAYLGGLWLSGLRLTHLRLPLESVAE